MSEIGVLVPQLIADIARVNVLLAANGTSLPLLGQAAQKTLTEMMSHPSESITQITAVGLEIAFPQLALFIAIGMALAPYQHPEQWNDPQRIARDDANPLTRLGD